MGGHAGCGTGNLGCDFVVEGVPHKLFVFHEAIKIKAQQESPVATGELNHRAISVF